jgi:flavin-dependent dehydrogenase
MVEGESERRFFTPFMIPVGGPLRTTAEGRVLLAGDAGGFVNGFSAEGIYYAMVTGELAASAVLAARQGSTIAPDRARRVYVRAWRAEIGAELRDSVLIQRYLFRTRDRMDGIVSAANSRPEFSQWLVDYASGRMTYLEARRRLVSRFPRLVPKLAWVAWRGAR